MKKIIITGGSGFIGKNFINSLINKKFSIHNFDKLSKVSSSENFRKLLMNCHRNLTARLH